MGWDENGYEMWLGVTVQKNNLGELCMINGIFFAWSIIKNRGRQRYIDFVYLLMSLFLLNGSQHHSSATSSLTFLLGLCLLFSLQILRQRLKNIFRYFFIFIFIFAGLLLFSKFAVEVFTGKTLMTVGVEAAGRDLTLTGRTELWQDMLKIASKHPFLGVGYGNFWIGNLGNDLWKKHIWHPAQGHNGYIDIYVELGIVGLFLFSLFVISSLKNIIHTFDSNFEYGKVRFVLFIVILLHNITESYFLKGTSNLWFIFLLAALSTPEKNRNHVIQKP